MSLKCKFVILNASPCVILSAAKNLSVWLRINSVKNLVRSLCYKTEILRLGPQNDIATQPLDRGIQIGELDYPVKPDNDANAIGPFSKLSDTKSESPLLLPVKPLRSWYPTWRRNALP